MIINKTFSLSLCLFLLFVFSGCALSGVSGSSRQLEHRVQTAREMTMDPEVEKASRAMHLYMLGEMALESQDREAALENFQESSELLSDSDPSLERKLALLHLRSGDGKKTLTASSRALQEGADSFLQELKAGVLYILGESGEAEREYRKLLEEDPDRLDPYLLLNVLLLEQGRRDDALAVMDQLQKVKRFEGTARYYRSRIFELQGALENAEKELQKAVLQKSEGIGVQRSYTRVLLLQGKHQQAEKYLEGLLSQETGNVFARRAQSALLQKKLFRGEYPSILEPAPLNFDQTLLELSLLKMDSHQHDAVIRDLSLILMKNPDLTEARYYLASVFAGTGRRQEAVQELRSIPLQDPYFEKSRTFAVFLLRQEGKLKEAEQVARELLSAFPENSQVLNYLVLILRDLGDFREAQNLLEEKLDKDPDNDRLLFNYALILDDQKEKEQSLAVMEKVIRLNPQNSDALNFVAYSLAESQTQLSRAQSLVETALQMRPNDGYYLDTLGWVYYQKGEYQRAKETLEKAVQLTDSDVVILEHHGDVLVKLNDYEGALEVYRYALENARDQHKKTQEVEEAKLRLEEKIKKTTSHQSSALAPEKPPFSSVLGKNKK